MRCKRRRVYLSFFLPLFSLPNYTSSMFIYNTTFVVNTNRLNQWKTWLNDVYFPAVGGLMVTNGVEVFEVMTVSDDISKTFSVQWRCELPDNMDVVNQASTEVLSSLPSLFGEDCLHFSSVLRQYATE